MCLSNLLNRPCNVFFRFEDNREEGHGERVIGPGGRIFNHFQYGDTNWELRQKFVKLFFTQLLTGIFYRLPYKLHDFFSGNVVIRAWNQGQREFQVYQLEAFEQGQKVHRLAKQFFVTKAILINVAAEIIKIAAFPLSLVGLQFISVVGMICPMDGWMFTSIIEETFHTEMNIQERLTGTLRCCYFSTLVKMCFPHAIFFSFAAPCMQSLQRWDIDKLNCLIYHRYSEYSPVYQANHVLESNVELWRAYFTAKESNLIIYLTQDLRRKINLAAKYAKAKGYEKEDIRRPENHIDYLQRLFDSSIKMVDAIVDLKDQFVLGQYDKSKYETTIKQLIQGLHTASHALGAFDNYVLDFDDSD